MVPFTSAPATAAGFTRSTVAARSTLVWTAEQPEVFALAIDGHGHPVRRDVAGRQDLSDRERKGHGVLRTRGEVHLVDRHCAGWYDVRRHGNRREDLSAFNPDGKGQVYFDSGQAHITSLAIDSQGRLLAGSEPNGILYRLTGPNKAFVLYDANLPEIRSILPTG